MRYAESVDKSGERVMNDCWIRRCRVTFFSVEPDQHGKGMSVVLGDNPNDNLDIKIKGVKELALLKDNGTIAISNLSYDTVSLIMAYKLFGIKVEIGYRSSNDLFCVAKGQVSFIQEKIHSRHDMTWYVMYASEFVAKWSQRRINFSIRSGVNVFDMINYMFLREGGAKTNLSPALRNIVLSQINPENQTIGSVIEQALSNTNTAFTMSADSSFDDAVINVTTLSDKRYIKIDPSMINIVNGNPTITSDGLEITFQPVFDFCPGDIIHIENRFIDASSGVSDTFSAAKTFNTNYLDQNGNYMIRHVDYVFENRGNNFYFKCRAVALSVFQGITGVVQ